MKHLILLVILVVSSVAATDKEIIQSTLNGLFKQNGLPVPTTVVSCFDDDTAHKVVLFVG